MTPIEIYIEYTYTFNISEEELRAAAHYGRDGLYKDSGRDGEECFKGGREVERCSQAFIINNHP